MVRQYGACRLLYKYDRHKHQCSAGLGVVGITNKHYHVSNLYDASMPYFMRLTDSGIGMHVGPVFQTPQSHGCIRMTRSSCVPLFKTVKVGTPVTIVQ